MNSPTRTNKLKLRNKMNISSKDGHERIVYGDGFKSYIICYYKRILILSHADAKKVIDFLEEKGMGSISFADSSPETYDRFHLVSGDSDSFGVIELENSLLKNTLKYIDMGDGSIVEVESAR